ncbi:DUF4262 domain-containing protein [Sphingomonas sp.]|uniref:DUF4262 domain-containing protein n=1 Tax=Sphingomonas sp. TaxID=28214 RepID=UPI002DD61A8D|nr:DUF4262 domain-containing protein [Sphingomonas sp.]
MTIAVEDTRLADAPARYEDHGKQLLIDVTRHGWRTTSVPERPGHAGFSYTSGFWVTYGAPEVVAFDLTPQTRHALFSKMAHEIGAGRSFAPGEPVSGLLDGEQVWFVPVGTAQAKASMGGTDWLYRGAEFPALQLMWPDAEGRFPWQTGFEPGLVGVQPDLSGTGDWGGLASG